MDKGFRKTVEVLNRLEEQELDREDAAREIATLLKTVGAEQVESLLRIMRMDFGEASRIIGTHLARRIVSEALVSITPLKHGEVEDLLRSGRIVEALSRRSTTLIEEGLSVSQVYMGILDVCSVSGKGSIGSKASKLAGLLNRASEEEAVFMLNTLLGKHRPVSDRLILRAAGEAFHGSAENQIKLMEEACAEDIYKTIKKAAENAGRGGT